MTDQVRNGETKETTLLDEGGSTMTVHQKYYQGNTSKPRRVSYKIRKRVTSAAEGLLEFEKFLNELDQDTTMVEPSMDIDQTKQGKENGYFYVIKCYTKLEY